MDIDVIAFYSKVSSIALSFPGVVPSTSYGTPAFKVNNKMFARFKEDGKTLVVYTNERDKWMKGNPATFFITDHYKNYPAMLIDLAAVKKKELKELLYASWEIRAPRHLLKKNE
ncbi:MAG: MmcQ/YjbR family DNA-binding protein [Chitinophagales bacterium]